MNTVNSLVTMEEMEGYYNEPELAKKNDLVEICELRESAPDELSENEKQKSKSNKRVCVPNNNAESSLFSEEHVIAESSLLPEEEELPILKETCYFQECTLKCTELSRTEALTNTNIATKLANLDSAPNYISETEIQNLYASVKEEMLSLSSLTPELINHTLRWPRADITRGIDVDDKHKNKTLYCSKVASTETENKSNTCSSTKCEVANLEGDAEVCTLTQSVDVSNKESERAASEAKGHESERSKHKKSQRKKKERSGSRVKKTERTPCVNSMNVTKSIEEVHNTCNEIIVEGNNVIDNRKVDHKYSETNDGNVKLLDNTIINEERHQTHNEQNDKITNEYQLKESFSKVHTLTMTPLVSSRDLVAHSPKLIKEHVLQVERWDEQNLTPRRKHKGKKRKVREHYNECPQKHQVNEMEKSQEQREENSLQKSANVQRMCSDALCQSDSANLLHLTNYTNTSQSEMAQSSDLLTSEVNHIITHSYNCNKANALEYESKEKETNDQRDKVQLVTPLQESQLIIVCDELPHNSTGLVSNKSEHHEEVEERQEAIWAAIEDRDKLHGDVGSNHGSDNAWLQIYKAVTPKVDAMEKQKSSSRYASSTEKIREDEAGVTNVALNYIDIKSNDIDKKHHVSEFNISRNSDIHHRRKKRQHSSNKKIIVIKEPTAAKRRLKRRRRRISESNVLLENKPSHVNINSKQVKECKDGKKHKLAANYHHHHLHHHRQRHDNDAIQRDNNRNYKSEQEPGHHHHCHRSHRHQHSKRHDNNNYNHYNNNVLNEKHLFRLEHLELESHEHQECEEEQNEIVKVEGNELVEHNAFSNVWQCNQSSNNCHVIRPSPPSHARGVEGSTNSPYRHRFYLQEEINKHTIAVDNKEQCNSVVETEKTNNVHQLQMQEVEENNKEIQETQEKIYLARLPSSKLLQQTQQQQQSKLEFEQNNEDNTIIHVNDTTEELQRDTELECMHHIENKPESLLQEHKEKEEQEENCSLSSESFLNYVDETKVPIERVNQVHITQDEDTINALCVKSSLEQCTQLEEIQHNDVSAPLPPVPANSISTNSITTTENNAVVAVSGGNVGMMENKNDETDFTKDNNNNISGNADSIIDKIDFRECRGDATNNKGANISEHEQDETFDQFTENQANINATAVIDIDNTSPPPPTMQEQYSDLQLEFVNKETSAHECETLSESAAVKAEEEEVQEQQNNESNTNVEESQLVKPLEEEVKESEVELSHLALDHVHHSSSSSSSSCLASQCSASPSVTPHLISKQLVQSATSFSSHSSLFSSSSRSSSFLSSASHLSSFSASSFSSSSSSWSSSSSSSSSVHSILPQRLPCKDGCETGPPPRVFADVIFRQQHLHELKQFAETALIYEWDVHSGKWGCVETLVVLSLNPFSCGNMRASYRVIDLLRIDCDLVVKRYLKSHVECIQYFDDVCMHSVAGHWARLFNATQPPKQIKFVPAAVLRLPHRQPALTLALEPLLRGTFRKYNNNCGYVPQHARWTPQAFSHFTYEASHHALMVVDIQGVEDIYTDPQILSRDGNGYGRGNLGKKGMKRFLQSHNCNSVCHQLNLKKITHVESNTVEHNEHNQPCNVSEVNVMLHEDATNNNNNNKYLQSTTYQEVLRDIIAEKLPPREFKEVDLAELLSMERETTQLNKQKSMNEHINLLKANKAVEEKRVIALSSEETSYPTTKQTPLNTSNTANLTANYLNRNYAFVSITNNYNFNKLSKANNTQNNHKVANYNSSSSNNNNVSNSNNSHITTPIMQPSMFHQGLHNMSTSSNLHNYLTSNMSNVSSRNGNNNNSIAKKQTGVEIQSNNSMTDIGFNNSNSTQYITNSANNCNNESSSSAMQSCQTPIHSPQISVHQSSINQYPAMMSLPISTTAHYQKNNMPLIAFNNSSSHSNINNNSNSNSNSNSNITNSNESSNTNNNSSYINRSVQSKATNINASHNNNANIKTNQQQYYQFIPSPPMSSINRGVLSNSPLPHSNTPFFQRQYSHFYHSSQQQQQQQSTQLQPHYQLVNVDEINLNQYRRSTNNNNNTQNNNNNSNSEKNNSNVVSVGKASNTDQSKSTIMYNTPSPPLAGLIAIRTSSSSSSSSSSPPPLLHMSTFTPFMSCHPSPFESHFVQQFRTTVKQNVCSSSPNVMSVPHVGGSSLVSSLTSVQNAMPVCSESSNNTNNNNNNNREYSNSASYSASVSNSSSKSSSSVSSNDDINSDKNDSQVNAECENDRIIVNEKDKCIPAEDASILQIISVDHSKEEVCKVLKLENVQRETEKSERETVVTQGQSDITDLQQIAISDVTNKVFSSCTDEILTSARKTLTTNTGEPNMHTNSNRYDENVKSNHVTANEQKTKKVVILPLLSATEVCKPEPQRVPRIQTKK